MTLEEAKLHLRVDHSDEDSMIGRLIGAARRGVEAYTWRALITQTWDVFLEEFPPERLNVPEIVRFDEPHAGEASDRGEVWLPLPPLQSVESISYVDTDGETQSLALDKVIVDTSREPGRIVPAHDETWPVTRVQPESVTIQIKAGYGDDEEDVPENIRQAVLLMLGHLYANRESVVLGTIATQVPQGVKWLLDQETMRGIG